MDCRDAGSGTGSGGSVINVEDRRMVAAVTIDIAGQHVTPARYRSTATHCRLPLAGCACGDGMDHAPQQRS